MANPPRVPKLEPPTPPAERPLLTMLFNGLGMLGGMLQSLGTSEPEARKTAADYLRRLADRIDPPTP